MRDPGSVQPQPQRELCRADSENPAFLTPAPQFIAAKLLELNERSTYKDPARGELSEKQLIAQEEEIFQTARLINCGWFGSAVFADYVAAILGLVRQGSSWSLNPFEEIRNLDHSLFERGRGNACSVEVRFWAFLVLRLWC